MSSAQQKTFVQQTDQELSAYGFFAAAVSAVALIGICILRSGLENPHKAYATTYALMLSTVFFPFIFTEKTRSKLYQNFYLVLFLAVAILSSPILSYFVNGKFQGIYFLLAAYASIHAFIKLKTESVLKSAVAFFLIPTLFFIHILESDQLRMIYFHEAAPLGLVHAHNYFYAAMANMAEKFGVPSLGVDGWSLAHYHVGSHFWFGMLARLTGARPDLLYPAGQFAVMIPLLLWAVLVCSMVLRNKNSSSLNNIFFISAIIIIGDKLGASLKNNTYVITSFTPSIVLFLLYTTALFDFSKTNKRTIAQNIAFITFATVGVFVIGSLKIPSALIYCICLGYVFYKTKGISLFTITSGLFALMMLLAVKGAFSPKSFFLSGYLLRDAILQMVSLSCLYSYVFPLTYCYFLFSNAEAHFESNGKSTVAFSSKKSLREIVWGVLKKGPADLKEALLISFLASVALAVGLRVAASGLYFFYLLTWFCYVILLSRWSGSFPRFIKNYVYVALVPLVPLILWGTVQSSYEDLKEFRKEISAKINFTEPFNVKSILKSKKLFSDEFLDMWSKNDWIKLTQTIQKMDVESHARNEKLAVYIPKTNADFWLNLDIHHPYECVSLDTYIPSTTSVPLLLGLSKTRRISEMDHLGVWWDLDCPERKNIQNEPRSDQELCSWATERSFDAVLVVPLIQQQSQIRKISCNHS